MQKEAPNSIEHYHNITHEELLGVSQVLLDCDGTLYPHDSPDGVMDHGSSLKKALDAKRLEFIIRMEKDLNDNTVDEEGAQQILQTCFDAIDKTGASIGISRRYKTPVLHIRLFEWDLRPEGIVKNFELQVMAVRKLKQLGKGVTLLTQAPSIWANRVVNYVGLSGVFDHIYSWPGKSKKEIFLEYALFYGSKNIVSIGDQKWSDIDPAIESGLRVFLVNDPMAFPRLVMPELVK
jgi:FMN phosphatase YigB (HAD superfamily)